MERRGKRFKHFREKYMPFYEEKEVAVMSPGGRSQHLRWCNIRNKTERLPGGKRTVQDYTFSFFEFLRKEVLNMNEILSHYGIKGMKWGVRRYQNSDGTLTSAGKSDIQMKISLSKKDLKFIV